MNIEDALNELIELVRQGTPLSRINQVHESCPRGGGEKAEGTTDFYTYLSAFDVLYADGNSLMNTEEQQILFERADVYELTRLI